jgi:hypothetical protein
MTLKPRITPQVKLLIKEVYLDMAKRGNGSNFKDIRENIYKRLKAEKLQPKPGWPCRSSIQEILQDVRGVVFKGSDKSTTVKINPIKKLKINIANGNMMITCPNCQGGIYGSSKERNNYFYCKLWGSTYKQSLEDSFSEKPCLLSDWVSCPFNRSIIN